MSEIEVIPIPNTPEKVWPKVAMLKNQLHYLAEMFIAEPNDGITRQHAENMIKTWLSHQYKHKQISDYAVSCNIFTNTPEIIDRCELKIDVAVKFYFWNDLIPDSRGFQDTTPFIFLPIVIGPDSGDYI
jgi:hypothetical protein